jgi:hypothetical protein
LYKKGDCPGKHGNPMLDRTDEHNGGMCIMLLITYMKRDFKSVDISITALTGYWVFFKILSSDFYEHI